MYERFISSSMLTGMRLVVGVVMNFAGPPEGSPYVRARRDTSARVLHVKVLDVECVVFDELAAGLDLITHQGGEHLIRLRVVFGANLQQRAILWIHRGRPQRIRVHFAETLVAIEGDALPAGGQEEFNELVDVVKRRVGLF